LRAFLNVSEGLCIGLEHRKDVSLERQTFFFRFGSGPGIRVGLSRGIFPFGIAIELGMKGVMRNCAGIPKRRVLPSAPADDKSRLFPPGFHAAAGALADNGDMTHDVVELVGGVKKPKRSFGAPKKFLMAANLDSLKHLCSSALPKPHPKKMPFKVQSSMFNRLLKNSGTCFDKLSMNGFSAVNSVPTPFVLSPSKDSEWFFQQPVNVGTGVDTLNLER
jgi:hypothetical protein